ncbi:MAG: thiosulfate oxidation carrier protein SoxY [Thiomargarita sp.]|nr:thiosulfate oxidation carrier protein SoxY [Thiomargarita sp.]
MNVPRRAFLKGVIATGGAMVLGSTLLPQSVMADWPKDAFGAESIDETLKILFEKSGNVKNVTTSKEITIEAPNIAENGAVVPVEVTANFDRVESIVIIGDKNPKALVAQFNFPNPDNAVGWVKTRIKLGQTSNIVAVVKANGKLYMAKREVKVTIGGCGG